MTDEQIIEALATKVMGWEKKMSPPDYVIGPEWYWWSDGEPIAIVSSWNPLKHIQHAWLVVEKLKDTGFHFLLLCSADSGLSIATFYMGPQDRSDDSKTDHDPRRSICLAALKAHGIEV